MIANKSMKNNEFLRCCLPASVKRMNAPVQFTAPVTSDMIGASNEQRRSSTRGKAMNTPSSKRSTILTVSALALGITAGFVYFAPSLANEQIQMSVLNSKNETGSMSASRKVRCIMPPAWRRDCE